MTVADDICDFCKRYVDPIGGDTAKALVAENPHAGDPHRLWCGQCSKGRREYYQQIVPLTHSFIRAAIIADSHDLKRGDYKDGWERNRILDRIYDFSQWLKEDGVEFDDDCNCGEC